MVSTIQGLQGRNVYGSGSFAPTKGAVSAQGAQGYLQRQVRLQNNAGQYGGVSRTGGDGQSDTRSGVAAMALQRRQQMAGGVKQPFQNHGRPKNTVPDGKVAWNNTGRMPSNAMAGSGHGHGNAYNHGGNTPTPVPPPAVTVNDQGQLELPYNPAYSQQIYQDLGDYNTQLADISAQQQAQALSYMQDTAGLNNQNTQNKKSTLNNSASRGMAFSSQYGLAVSQNEDSYRTAMAALENANAGTNSDLSNQRDAITNSFKQQLSAAAQAYAEQVAQQAGTLGYGTHQPPVRQGQNSSDFGPNNNHNHAHHDHPKSTNSSQPSSQGGNQNQIKHKKHQNGARLAMGKK